MDTSLVDGTLSHGIRIDAVRQLLRVFGEVGELADLHARRLHLVLGLRRILHATQAMFVFAHDFGPSGRGTIKGSVFIDHDDCVVSPVVDGMDIAARFQPYVENGARFDPALAKLTGLNGPEGVVTRRRRELVSDREWYEAGEFSVFLREKGIDDAIFSARRCGEPNRIVGVAVRRAFGEREFTNEERNLVHICNLEMEALVGPGTGPITEEPPLSPRERDTLDLLLMGASEKEVAHRLGLSVHTVHVYVKALYRAFGVQSRAELLARFVRSPPASRLRDAAKRHL